MKKSVILMAIAIMSVMVSCQTSAPKAKLTNNVDTLSYSIGVAQSQGLKDYLVQRMGMDTTYMSNFIQGVVEGVNMGDNDKQSAYMNGIQIGQQVANQIIPGITQEVFGNDSTKALDKDNFLAGFIAGTLEKGLLMEADEAQMTAQRLMEEFHNEAIMNEFGQWKADNEAFMDSIAQCEGVQKTNSGLCYKVITEGKGATPNTVDRVKVNYRGTLIDGTEFDSSYKRGEPATFRVSQVISGWTEALCMMPVGSKWELYIPQQLAYGDQGQHDIKPFSALTFEVELVEICK